MQLTGKSILLGVSGGIAAYKALLLLRLLQKAGAEVRVILTPAATAFVQPLSFATLSQHEVFTDLWASSEDWTKHVHWGKWADALVIAPATTNTLAKMAQGLCDNALLATYLSCPAPVYVAPAMDVDMARHPSLHRNLRTLEADGVEIIPAANGYLASGYQGPGRMAEPEEIVQVLQQALGVPQLLQGEHVLVTAGPTREPLDPVRFLSNHSTGTMGIEMARAAHRLGAASVKLILGPTPVQPPAHLETHRVTTAQQMHAAVMEHLADTSLAIMAAAVSDFRPAETADHKIKKAQATPSLELLPNPDILLELGRHKQRHGKLRIIGFAMETQNGAEEAKRKREEKNCDMMVLNLLTDPRAGFGTGSNRVQLFHRTHQTKVLGPAPKATIATDILQAFAAFEELGTK